METPRFAVDKMLGRLATWLRLIGEDATYGAHLAGRTLIRHARTDHRTLLTRDSRFLHEASCPEYLFIPSSDFRDQLRQVVAAFHLDPFARLFTRCARCNDAVIAVRKSEVSHRVPSYVYSTQELFAQCPRCRRVYWPATHYARIRDELTAMGFRASA